MMPVLLAFAPKELDLSAHIEIIKGLELGILAAAVSFFVIRPELWKRVFFARVDPRPAALMRMSFGLVVFITFAILLVPTGPLPYSTARYLFTEDGLWLTDTARQSYGGNLRTLWDAEHGFEHWWDLFVAVGDHFSPLFLNSEPAFVFALYGVMLASLLLMIFGVWTRVTTLLAYLLVEWIYRYSPVFYTGGDTVIRVFFFLGVFTDWGRAYGFDSWWARRRAILEGATRVPALATIPAWPIRIMMLQLACIYCATGMLKSGGTWQNGTALYYTLCLDHFYRVPAIHWVTLAQFFGVLPLLTILVHWWEMLFPLALVGVAINAFERDRAAKRWPHAAGWRRYTSYALIVAAWAMAAGLLGIGVHYFLPNQALRALPRPWVLPTFAGLGMAVLVIPGTVLLTLRRFSRRSYDFVRHWLLGKRFWLTIGFGMHVGIATSMNVGTFAPIMMVVYCVWLSGDEVDAFWRYVLSVPAAPGDARRPLRKSRWLARALVPVDRILYRVPADPIVVIHAPTEVGVRHAALLRPWDLGHRLVFESDASAPPGRLRIRLPKQASLVEGDAAAKALMRVLPGLWPLLPFAFIPAGLPRQVRRMLEPRS